MSLLSENLTNQQIRDEMWKLRNDFRIVRYNIPKDVQVGPWFILKKSGFMFKDWVGVCGYDIGNNGQYS
jgi:hypothetical protein